MRFIDLQAQYRALKPEIDTNIRAVLDCAQFIGGPFVQELEERLAAFTGRKHCVTCANGTDALQVACMALGIGQGDAVFCTDVTMVASVEPAKLLGASVVFCDIDPVSYNISPAGLECQIKAVLAEGRLKPKAVIAVDIFGNPCDYDAILSLCETYGLHLVEDAAQSFGASFKGRRCGSFGIISTTSFFPAKPLGCYGDGGAIFLDDDELDRLCRSLCVHGKGPGGKYDNIRVGLNSRLDAIQAAVLLPKLRALEEYELEARQTVALRYNQAFAEKLITPHAAEGYVSAYAQYVLLAENAAQRDKIVAYLDTKNIPSMIYYPTPQHNLHVFQDEPHCSGFFPNAEEFCARTFSLPMYPYLEDWEQERIIDAVLEAIW